MEDYPRTLADFEERFRSEEACRDYLFRVRWPEGFRCPRCGESRGWRLRSALWQCARCAYQASLTAGTIFQDTRTPLKVWFHALWWMTDRKSTRLNSSHTVISYAVFCLKKKKKRKNIVKKVK